MVSLRCSSCQISLTVPESAAARPLACPVCQQPMRRQEAAERPDSPTSSVDPLANTDDFPSVMPVGEGPLDGGPPTDAPTPTFVHNHEPRSVPAPQAQSFPFLKYSDSDEELGWLGPYHILRVIGRGGMGIVFLADDLQLHRKLAIKVMRPEVASDAGARARFLREAQVAASVQHLHVVMIIEVAEEDGLPYLVMPYLIGEPLDFYLKKMKRLDVTEAVRIAREMADGLAAAHEVGLVHRDIKPGNVWLEGSRRRVKLLDFGLARAVVPAQDDAQLTEAGAVLGTIGYCAPEQINGETIDHRADLFALGCTLYEMLTGQRPYAGGSLVQMAASMMLEETPSVRKLRPEVPERVAILVDCLLSRYPVDRPETARIVEIELAEIEQELRSSPPSKPIPTPIDPPSPKRSFGWLGVAVAALLLAAGVGGGLYFTRQTDPPTSSLVVDDSKVDPEPTIIDDPKKPSDPPEQSPPPQKDPTPLPPPPPPPPPPDKIENSIRLRLIRLPAGRFTMGSPESEDHRHASETQHKVEISRPFYLGAFEVTRRQYRAVMGDAPGAFTNNDDLPIESVTWAEASTFCRKLTALPEEATHGRVYRLPSEAEWEYAAREAGASREPFATGDSLGAGDANFDWRYPYGNGQAGTPPDQPTPIGQTGRANRLNLWDLHGNVAEWCSDWAGDYAIAPLVRDPAGPATGTRRVVRGGSWFVAGHLCRSAARFDAPPDRRDHRIGFRVVMTLTEP